MKYALRLAGNMTALLLLLLLAACSKEPDTVAADDSAQPHAVSVKPAFINKVWEVSLSTGVAPGMLYAFLSDGTLVITSPNSQAAFGAWTYKDGVLRTVEASQEYKVDILNLSQDELRLRSHHPGGSVEIVLVPARQAPLP